MAVVIAYFNELGVSQTAVNFQISVDGTVLPKFVPDAAAGGFYIQQYAVAPSVTSGKSKVTVRFEADSGGRIPPIFGVRAITLD